MPKVTLNPEEVTKEILFGTALEPVSLSVLSYRTGIPVSTLSTYRKHPDMIPLGRARAIVKARRLTVETIGKLFGR